MCLHNIFFLYLNKSYINSDGKNLGSSYSDSYSDNALMGVFQKSPLS